MVEFLERHFLATILEREFEDFQLCMVDMREWPTYDDFVMDREGFFIGMSWAGLNVVQVEAPFRLFMRWINLTGSPCGLRELDDFAMRRWLRAKYPEWNPRLVRSKSTSLVADWSGQLYIPLRQATEALQESPPPAQSGEDDNQGLARVIAMECLDPVG